MNCINYLIIFSIFLNMHSLRQLQQLLFPRQPTTHFKIDLLLKIVLIFLHNQINLPLMKYLVTAIFFLLVFLFVAELLSLLMTFFLSVVLVLFLVVKDLQPKFLIKVVIQLLFIPNFNFGFINLHSRLFVVRFDY